MKKLKSVQKIEPDIDADKEIEDIKQTISKSSEKSKKFVFKNGWLCHL